MIERGNTMINKIKLVMMNYGGTASLKQIYDDVLEQEPTILTKYKSRETFEASIRKVIEDHSFDSQNFKGIDVFKHVNSGVWGIKSIIKRRNKIEESLINGDNIQLWIIEDDFEVLAFGKSHIYAAYEEYEISGLFIGSLNESLLEISKDDINLKLIQNGTILATHSIKDSNHIFDIIYRLRN